MRHYVAAKKQADGLWHYTIGGYRPAGACARDCPGHATAKEAYEHERQRQLDELLSFSPDQPDASSAHKCRAPGCGVWTTGAAHVGAWKFYQLCAAHRSREFVEPLFCVGESWES